MKVLFICCGNICRSPMAEFIFKNMERYNLTNLPKLLGPSDKYHLLLDFTDKPGNIADSWYSGDFELAYSQIVKGCEGLLKKLQSR